MDRSLGWDGAIPTICTGRYCAGPVWSNRFKEEPVGTFVKVKTREGQVTWFREVCRTDEGTLPYYVWVTVSGGEWHPRREDTLLCVQKAPRFEDLDWTDTFIVQDSASGWLAPDGTFYPCRSEFHDLYARFVLHRERADMDMEGWVDVKDSTHWRSGWQVSNPDCRIGRPLTTEQRNWLTYHGHQVEDQD